MPLHETEGFVLRTYTLAEADKICIFLTKGWGKIRGVAHGARKLKSRFGSSLEPFTEVSLSFFQKEGRDLVSISNCDIVRSHFRSAARDVETAAAFSYLAELLVEFSPEHESNDRVYRLVAASLESVERGGDLGTILRYFETWILRLGGYFPDVTRCAACGGEISAAAFVFLAVDGTPRCEDCGGGRGTGVGPALRLEIMRLLGSHPVQYAAERLRSDHSSQLAEINHCIIRHVLERELRSHGPLRDLAPVT